MFINSIIIIIIIITGILLSVGRSVEHFTITPACQQFFT